MRVMRGSWLGIGAALASVGVVGAEPPSVSTYAGPPAIEQVRLSPDGERILMFRSVEGARHLFVTELETGRTNVAAKADPGSRFLSKCGWASNERIVCRSWVFGAADENEAPESYPVRKGARRLFAVNADGTEGRVLLRRFSRYRVGRSWFRFHPLAYVASYLPDDPDHVLVGMRRPEGDRSPKGHGAYRLNIGRGGVSKVVGNREGVSVWTGDSIGSVLVGAGSRRFSALSAGPTVVVVRDGVARRHDVPRLSGPQQRWTPRSVAFAEGGATVYMEIRLDGADRTTLWAVDAATLTPRRELASDARYGIRATAVEGSACGVVGFSHHRIARAFTWLDGEFGEMVEKLDRRLSGEIRAVPSLSADCRRMVVATLGGGHSKTYYVHDRDTGRTTRLGSEYPGLDGRLSHQERVEYLARDGTALAATVTVEPGPLGQRAPTVVLIPEGFYGRSSQDFDPWPHFLAHRGYAVLEPEFRGAPGRGNAFLIDGYREWSARMREDVWTGVEWMAGQGIGDPDRVCMVGRGHGGQLALAAGLGDSRTRCAALFVPSSAKTLEFVHDMGAYTAYWWWTGIYHELAHKLGATVDNPWDNASGWAPVGANATIRSPYAGRGHPGFPILFYHDRTRRDVHERETRAFAAELDQLADETHNRMVPDGGGEKTFLADLESLVERTLVLPEQLPARP